MNYRVQRGCSIRFSFPETKPLPPWPSAAAEEREVCSLLTISGFRLQTQGEGCLQCPFPQTRIHFPLLTQNWGPHQSHPTSCEVSLRSCQMFPTRNQLKQVDGVSSQLPLPPLHSSQGSGLELEM